jgi:hypothetical protein
MSTEQDVDITRFILSNPIILLVSECSKYFVLFFSKRIKET